MTQINYSATPADRQQALEYIRHNVKTTLAQVMGDSSAEMLNEMASIFLEDAVPLIDQMKSGLANGDYKTIHSAAHALKGSSATIGLDKFAEVCLAVETNSKQQQDELIDSNLVVLESQYSQIHQALSAFLF
ncbi:MAG: Hpt domain-containing protein [Candidatus Promineifilaceae bacterium]